jgi:hypothetical protein
LVSVKSKGITGALANFMTGGAVGEAAGRGFEVAHGCEVAALTQVAFGEDFAVEDEAVDSVGE